MSSVGRPTVNDIAKEAGVSLATVDRVLNERPGVRKKTVEKVNAAIAKIGYVRDITAANLARRREYHFVFVLPDGDSLFLQSVRDMVNEVATLSRLDRTRVTILPVPGHDPHQIAARLDELASQAVDGVAILAPETPPVRDAIRHLKEQDRAVVTLVSDQPNSDRDHFVGVDNVQAGRTAGALMGRFLGPGAHRVMVLVNSMQARDSLERRFGFDQVMAESFPEITVLPSLEGRDDMAYIAALLPRALEGRGDVTGLYVMGAGNREVSRVLKAVGLSQQVTVIAHELTDSTRRGLESGVVDAVITQNVGHIVRSAIRVLRATCDGTQIIEAQEKIRLEIVIRENLP
ncbi:LacI family DNA-binding transcriptional regulator [Pseudoruegeria sp. SHC-113]|uniref:LacI family DNA-binding transcriptional regulator n=1 Tax=Pseudoruegeria sp. SHC-113 TaxID=2855439 RepID=UPI0021BACB42|nr:LacI family DNA-binding transcriptional regulator [Pseudoruegeria sp. SHC-113]MCT8159454.1 LacI family DNA-binding transcriptional regulator [Pseudoruegeria sp. SHC-113]